MNRRDALRTAGTLTTLAVAGCTSLPGVNSVDAPEWERDRPDSVYYPAHSSGMRMVGSAQYGDRTVALSYTLVKLFTTVTGTRTERVVPDTEDHDRVHLMVSVWDSETETVLPVESGLRFEVQRQGDTVDQRAPWPMLSQQMGFHFGDNVVLPGNGEYTVTIDTGSLSLRRRGEFADKFADSGTVEIPFRYSRADRNSIPREMLYDSRYQDGALSPMEMDMLPLSVAPTGEQLPGRVLGEATLDGAVFLVTATDSTEGTYLAVSPRTPYNQYVLPMMALSATVERGNRTVFDDSLPAAIGPDRRYHYGTVVDHIQSGDRVTVAVDTPPQVARHDGYENVFLDMQELSVTVS